MIKIIFEIKETNGVLDSKSRYELEGETRLECSKTMEILAAIKHGMTTHLDKTQRQDFNEIKN